MMNYWLPVDNLTEENFYNFREYVGVGYAISDTIDNYFREYGLHISA